MKQITGLASKVLGELETTLSSLSNEKAMELVHSIVNAEKIIVAGAGRSGFMIKAFCMRLMHLGLEAYVVGETVTPNLTKKDILIIASGSGTTNTLVSIAEKAKNRIGAKLACITIDATSPIARLADTVLVIPAPSPKLKKKNDLHSIQPMGSLFEQSLLLTMDCIILLLMEAYKNNSSNMFTRHANLE